MNYSRTLTPICGLLATALLVFAQAPAAAPSPRPAAAPMAPLPPMPPMEPLTSMQAMAPIGAYLDDLDARFSLQFNPELQDKLEAVREQAERMKFDLEERTFAKDEMLAAKDMLRAQLAPFAFAPPQSSGVGGGVGGGIRPPTPPIPPRRYFFFATNSDDRLYASGQSALDNRQWDQALDLFSQVISRAGSRTDGALYWKAYALGKLGRRDDAAAAIAELRKSYAASRWLEDAKALELELKQASGQSVSPEAESDEELKLMAINGLMQSDPERAIPLLEGQLKGSASPKVKRNTLFVLAMSNSPKAQALLEQVARGGANPDLQLKAIGYMDQRRKPNNNAQVLSEIYAATNDAAVKRAILQSYAGMRDMDRLLQAAKTEKSPQLREAAINYLAGNNGTPELWQLYQTETTSEGKLQLLRYMHSNASADKLLELVRTEKDPKVRADAVRALASRKTGVTAETMVSVYSAEQDPQIKQSILDGLYSQRNAKALVDIARAEKDTKLKLRIVERLSNMKSKEATDYLEELLKK